MEVWFFDSEIFVICIKIVRFRLRSLFQAHNLRAKRIAFDVEGEMNSNIAYNERTSDSSQVINLDDYRVNVERHALSLRRMRRWKKEIFRDESFRDRFLIEPAVSPRDFAESMRLVHNSFVSAGYIQPCESGMRIRDNYEASSCLTTFIARDLKRGGKVVGTNSIVNDSVLGLPSENVFGKEIQFLKQGRKQSAEATGFAIHPDYQKTPVCFELARYTWGWAAFSGCDAAFMSVSPKTQLFFREILLFDKISEERSYSSTVFDPVVCLWSNPQASKYRAQEIDQLLGEDAFLSDYLFEKNPVFEYIKSPGVRFITSAYHRVLSEALVRYFENMYTSEENDIAQL